MKSATRNTFFILLVVLTGCASVGLPTATSFSERLAVGYGTVTQVRSTATDLLKAGKIKADDAQNVQNSADTARTALDVARTLSSTDLTGAGNKLQMATAILTAASAYLSTKR